MDVICCNCKTAYSSLIHVYKNNIYQYTHCKDCTSLLKRDRKLKAYKLKSLTKKGNYETRNK